MAEAAPEKKKRIAPTPEELEIKRKGELLLHYFSRPFMGRGRYLYTGFNLPGGVFVLGNFQEAKFEFGLPKYALYLVHAKLDEEAVALESLVFDTFRLPRDILGYINFEIIFRYLKKQKWKTDGIVVSTDAQGRMYLHPDVPFDLKDAPEEGGDDDEGDDDTDVEEIGNRVMIFTPVVATFVHDKIYHHVQQYIEVFHTRRNPLIAIDITDDLKRPVIAVRTDVSSETSAILGYPEIGSIKTVLVRGLDLIHSKFMVEKEVKAKLPPPTFKLALWQAGGYALNYGTYCETDKYLVMACRCDTVIIGNTQKRST
jgi:hypothetical protein